MPKSLLLPFAFFLSSCASSTLKPDSNEPARLHIGSFESRALYWKSTHPSQNDTAVLLIPGSGAQGPEEAMPAAMTLDSKDSMTFETLAKPFLESGISALALGKPGVEFFPGAFDRSKWFYSEKLYESLSWKDLLTNVDEGVKQLRSLGFQKIILLGHSEGTQIAVDYAKAHPGEIEALVLLGYSAENVDTILHYQLYDRPVEFILERELGVKHGSSLTKKHYSAVSGIEKELPLNWMGKESLTYAEVLKQIRNNTESKKVYETLKQKKIYADGIFTRKPIYEDTAAFPGKLIIFTGAEDVQTLPKEALQVKKLCDAKKRESCVIQILPGLGHNFSEPKSPRKNPFLDMTSGPPSPVLLGELKKAIASLKSRP